jgi:hypothetical protein
MPSIHTFRAPLLAGIAVAATIAGNVPSVAQDQRDAAVERCFAMARDSGEVTPGGAGGENRAAVYKDCMRKAGYRP